MEVRTGTVVSLRYCMKNSNGEILEDRTNTTPVKYVHGSKNIMPALQNSLTGLEPGNSANVTISNNMDLQLDASFYFEIVIDDVRLATGEEILTGKPVTPVLNDDETCGPGCNCC